MIANKSYTVEDFKRWGAIGGAKSRRKLTKKQARAMVLAREARRKARLEQSPVTVDSAGHDAQAKHV